MRSKKIFSFDEEKDAEEIIENGFENNLIDYSGMYLIAKYFRDKFGYGEIRLERELIKFCKKQDENFNPVVDAEYIKKWVKSAMNYGLRKIEKIQVSRKEIDFLKTIETTKERKLLFMTLVMAKALKFRNTKRKQKKLPPSKKYYIHYNSFRDIIRLSGLTNVTEIGLASILHKHREHFTFYNPEKQLIKVNFIDSEIKRGIRVDDMDDLLGYYDRFFVEEKEEPDEKPFRCEKCKNITEKVKNNQKYCDTCAIEVKKERDRERIRLKRSKI